MEKLSRDETAKDHVLTECDPPEYARIPKPRKTQAGDIYAMGTIMAFIASASDQVNSNVHADAFLGTMHTFKDLVDACRQADPTKRPTTRNVAKLFTQIPRVRMSRGQTIVERVLSRLCKYTSIMEDAVEERTSDLILERRKCDDLLVQILPQ